MFSPSMHSTSPSFTNRDDRQQLGPYRAVSWLAIAALACGLFSSLALSHPALWLVPVLAVLLALWALGRIAAREGLVGTLPAVIGMSLALFFGSWAVSSFVADRSTTYREARIIAQQWLQLLLDGQLNAAHQALIALTGRQSPGMPLDEFYEHDERAKRQKDAYFAEAPVSDVVALGKRGRIRFVRNVSQESGAGNSRLIQQEFELRADDGNTPIAVIVGVGRSAHDAAGRIGWQILGLSDAKTRTDFTADGG